MDIRILPLLCCFSLVSSLLTLVFVIPILGCFFLEVFAGVSAFGTFLWPAFVLSLLPSLDVSCR